MKYNLEQMLKEIVQDERRKAAPRQKLSQAQIRELLKQRKKEQK